MILVCFLPLCTITVWNCSRVCEKKQKKLMDIMTNRHVFRNYIYTTSFLKTHIYWYDVLSMSRLFDSCLIIGESLGVPTNRADGRSEMLV
jgi:hypothetical protein